jgi:hypothetical protein
MVIKMFNPLPKYTLDSIAYIDLAKLGTITSSIPSDKRQGNLDGANGARIRDRLSDRRSNQPKIASLGALWYVAEIEMRRSGRIFAAILVLAALVPTAFGGRANLICIESSGRISFGCNDVVPDEIAAQFTGPTQLGLSSDDCGFCHDYTVGQAVTQSILDLALPAPVVGLHQQGFAQHSSALLIESHTVAILDSSGNVAPLKC